jgi:hypothetical protein
MAALTQRPVFTEDEDLNDFDPAFFPKKVFKDGRGPRVRLTLTDAAPPRAVFDARNHQPRYAVVDRGDPHVRAAEAAYADHNAYLRDAWRGKDNSPPPDLKDGESSRDAYVRRLQNAYRTPIGQAPDDDDHADDIERLRQAWLSPGAQPGPGPGYGDARPAVSRETATKDAAAADRDQAYAEYVARIENGWRR